MKKNHLVKFFYFILISLIYACGSQSFDVKKPVEWSDIESKYSSAELRGSNSEFRNWWNVIRYDLVIIPDFNQKSISGTVNMEFEITSFSQDSILQIDLQQPMRLTHLTQLVISTETQSNQEKHDFVKSAWTHKENVIFIDLKQIPVKHEGIQTLKFYFEGNPKIAQNPPWDGGWIFTEDEKGRPWMSAAVQGLGASSWFPCKDFQADKPDLGATISIIVPQDLVAVSNGRLWETSFVKGEPGTNVYTWEVRNPINTYNIIPYIGHYEQIVDSMLGENGKLSLEYWVLDYNKEKAKKHFQQVKPMISAFEDWMGPYPFYEDGYKLVESPHLGMEHQSAIAYGNQYLNGYLGHDRTNSGYGNQFDFILIHESGHEWFGNSITSKDIADLWIHEGFTTYSEAMYVENQFGKKAADSYIQGLRPMIENKNNLIGVYGIHQTGSVDMYNKGANILHTLRAWMNDDVKFKQMIRDMNKKYFHQTVTSKQIENFIADYADLELTSFFDQYLRTSNIPVLEVKNENNDLYYQWINVVEGFEMPLKLNDSEEWIYPTTTWQKYSGQSSLIPDLNFYVLNK